MNHSELWDKGRNMKIILLIALLVSCSQERSKRNRNVRVQNKYCIDQCISHYIKSLHSKQFLGGSSSADGMQQKNVMVEIKKYCEEFYKNEKCYQHHVLWDSSNVLHPHGYDFVILKKEIIE